MVGFDSLETMCTKFELLLTFRFWVTSGHETDGQTECYTQCGLRCPM